MPVMPKMYQLTGNMFALDLIFDRLYDARTWLYAGVEHLFIPVQHARRETVKAPMRASCINIDGEIAIFFRFAFRLIYRFHFNILLIHRLVCK